MNIPVVIPAFEPDEKLVSLVDDLITAQVSPIVIVDDGSDSSSYGHIFDSIEKKGCIIIRHAVNLGKGRALKTAFNFCLNLYPDLLGCVTADSDGQHKASDIQKCIDVLKENSEKLILGCRNFDEAGIPARSVFGNKMTSMVMKLLLGLSISDTQTGLRGIGTDFMKYLMNEKGERFEFETNMLIATKDLGMEIFEFPIKTIYIDSNKTSHFNPLLDSVRIYKVFVKYLISSLSASVIDIILFAFLCKVIDADGYIIMATVVARLISSIYNYLINYKAVFKSNADRKKTTVRYGLLAICIMILSGLSVTAIHGLLWFVPEVVIKIVVDSFLFFLSFIIQREFVYR